MDKLLKPIGQARVLIVDDVPSARKILGRFITDCGIGQIDHAPNGAEALAFLKKNEIDIVISDWHMPQMDGIALVTAMKGESKLKSIPFIMITSSNEVKEVTMALQSGISDYICKPFSLEIIKRKIEKYFIL